jgi:mannitol/fructose-specific phosphotransferase system IIA component (Ntr-type)
MTHLPCDRLTKALREGVIRVPLSAGDFASAVRELLVPVLSSRMPPARVDEVITAVLRREESGSTCTGAVSFPHARVPDLSTIIASIGVNPREIYPGGGVRLMLAFVSPQGEPAEHLRFLSEAAKALRDAPFLEQLVSARNADELLASLASGQ